MKSVVYFAECKGRIKIGFSRDLPTRISALGSGNPEQIVVLATLPGGRSLEARIHSDLAAHRHKNEWFNDCAEVRAAINRFSAIAYAEAHRLEMADLASNELVVDASKHPVKRVNFLEVSGRFTALLNLDLIDRLSDARRSEKKMGLARGALMDRILEGDDRRKRFGAAIDVLLASHKKFGKLLDICALKLFDEGADLTPYYAVSEQLVSAAERAFEPFRDEIMKLTAGGNQ